MDLLYERHVPQMGYEKVWPSTHKCPTCEDVIITYPGSHRPLYIPALRFAREDRFGTAGEYKVIYTCLKCNRVFSNRHIKTVAEAKKIIEDVKKAPSIVRRATEFEMREDSAWKERVAVLEAEIMGYFKEKYGAF